MRCLLQRVSSASVGIEGVQTARIGTGLLVLACAMKDDSRDNAERIARKVASMRIFRDGNGKMNRSVMDTRGKVLVVSQFTLAASVAKGNRPSFIDAAPPDIAVPVYEHFIATLESLGLDVESGKFGAEMQVSLVNDGPVTIWVEM